MKEPEPGTLEHAKWMIYYKLPRQEWWTGLYEAALNLVVRDKITQAENEERRRCIEVIETERSKPSWSGKACMYCWRELP